MRNTKEKYVCIFVVRIGHKQSLLWCGCNCCRWPVPLIYRKYSFHVRRNSYRYRKNQKNLETRKNSFNHPKIWIMWFYHVSESCRLKGVKQCSLKSSLIRVYTFPHYNPKRAIRCHGNQSSDLICVKTCCSLSPSPMMLQIKFSCNRPAGLGDIHVWKCGRTDGCTDASSSPIL